MSGGVNPLQEQAQRVLAPFGFTTTQKQELWTAYQQNPDGVERCSERAKAVGSREGNTGAGLLLLMIRNHEHELEPDPNARRITGWRFVRGTHSGTYVPDPTGTDPLPAGYDFTPSRNPRADTEFERLELRGSEPDFEGPEPT